MYEQGLYNTQTKQVRKCTHSVIILALSTLFDFRPLRIVPVMSQLSGANDLCVGRVSAPVWMGDDVIMVDSRIITHSVTSECRNTSRSSCKVLVVVVQS
jgi:hypothetical protein